MIGNLPPDFLYKKIPDGVLNEDVRQLLRAVVGGFQDKVSEMRTLADQIRDLWVPDNSVGEPYPVVVVTYTDPETFEVREITLNVNDSTPDSTASTSDIFAWCASEINVDSSQISGAEFTTDLARTAQSRTLLLLADTIGAKLYDNLSSANDEVILNQKRALKTYFSRLKVKGTALSFELLGRLQGFDDVKFVPLWGRVSPRIPNNVGSTQNDADFSQDPQGLPTPGQPTALYNPNALNDGDIYTWTSGLLSVNENQTDFILEGINGFNPYVTIQAVAASSALLLPIAGTYFLKGGAFGIKAKTDILPAANGASSGIRFVAIADGSSFNSAQIVVSAATATDSTPRVVITIYHNLSSIKFRTSYFNLSAAVSYDSYVADNTSTAQTSNDLKSDPTLWQDLEPEFPANSVPFANDGVANDPFRPWTGGSKPLPVVQTWPDLLVSEGSGVPSNRVQASVDTPALDLSILVTGGTRFVSNIDDIRPATRYLRKFRSGLSISTDVQYAPHISRKLLAAISATTTYAGSAGTLAVDYPTLPFTGSFRVSVRVQTFTLAMSPVSDTTIEYPVASESLPVTPTTVDLSFVHPVDPLLLAFTGSFDFANATYSVTVTNCGYTGVSNVFVVTANFYGLWQAVGTDRLQKEPPFSAEFSDTRHYQPQPEDELELTYLHTLNDSYPWHRALVGGGEELLENEDNAEESDLRELVVKQTAQVKDEEQKVFDVIGVDFNLSDRGFVVLTQNTIEALGQRAVGFRLADPVQAQNDETEHSGPLSTVLEVQLGVAYTVGSVRGVLVADPSVHWTPAQASGLVAWFHCGEHPQQPYLLVDQSDNALTEIEIESGAFLSNYLLADRVWDTSRGWMLSLRGQDTDQAVGFFSVNKNRLVGNDYTISFWIKVVDHGLADMDEAVIFHHGPIQVRLGIVSSAFHLQVYAIDPITGLNKATGNPVTVSSTPTFFSFAVASLNPDNLIQVTVATPSNIADFFGLPIIDGVQLIDGMTVLLTGQTNPVENGHYFVSETNWIRVEVVDGVDERGKYFNVQQGIVNFGLYQNTNANVSPLVYGTDGVTYSRYNCTWHGSPGTATQAFLKPFALTDTLLKFNAPAVDQSPAIVISDLRIWSVSKTEDELTFIETPALKPTSVSARPTFFTSTRGDYRAFEVLPSGYVFPSVKPIDYYLERLTRALRYNGRGEYVGRDSRIQVGYGDWKPITAVSGGVKLGLAGPDLRSQGTSVAATTSSDLPGFNSFWYADAASGHYRRVPVPYVAVEPNDNTTSVADPASSFHPTEMPVQNPDQARVYIRGEDGNMYRVTVHVAHLDSGDTVTLFAELAPRVSGVSQLTKQNYKLDLTDVTEILATVGFYDLFVNYPTDSELQPEFITDAETLVERSGVGRIGVSINSDGEPEVAILPDSGKDTPPIFLFSHYQSYLAYKLAQDATPWTNPFPNDIATYGLPVRSESGPMIFAGTDATLSPGRYSIVIDATALGALDPEFKGFDVEVSVSAIPINDPNSHSTSIIEAVLLPNGNSSFTTKYTDGGDTLVAPSVLSNCSPAQLQTALDSLDALTGGVTVQTAAGPTKSFVGGPYYVKFDTNGARSLLQFTALNGLNVAVNRVVVGDGSTQEIQKIVLNRPMTVVELNVTDQVLFDGSHNWTLQIYLTNPRTTATTVRRLAIHNLWIFKIASQLYQVDPGVSTPQLTLVTAPGGLRTLVDQTGTATTAQEDTVFANRELPSTVSDPKLPAAHPLTGSTVDRTQSVIAQSDFQLPNATPPAELPAIKIRLLIDNGGPPDPNNPPLTPIIIVAPPLTQDDMESYTNNDNLVGLNGGIAWGDAYVDRNSGALTQDDFESYSDNDQLLGLNGGVDWANAYADRTGEAATEDDLESYADTAPLAGLNGGTSWNNAYIDRASSAQIGFDDLESYTNGAALTGLNAGTGWSGGYVARP